VTAPRLRRLILHGCTILALLCGVRCRAQDAASAQALEQSAARAREAGNREQAIADYKQALALHPDWPEGLWYLGTLNYDLDRYADAIPPLAALVKLAPESGPAFSFLGLAEFEVKNYPSALAHLEKAQALGNADDPGLAQVCSYHLALLLNQTSQFDRAAALLRATFPQQDPPAQAKAAMGIALLHIPLLPSEIDPSHDALLEAAGAAAALKDPRQTEEELAQLIVQYPGTPYLQAQTARQQEAKLEHANLAALYRIHAAGEAASSPPATDAGWQQAMADYSSGRYAETIAALKAWVLQKPDDGTAWAVMGLSEFELKDYDNALIHLQRGQQLGVGASRQASSFAIYHLALLLDRSGQFDAATAALTPIHGYQPMQSDMQFVLGLALLHMPVLSSDVEAAKRPLVESAGQIALLLLDSKYDAAFPQFQKLIAQYPDTPWLHYAYGTALDSLSQYEEARAQMREEAKLSPQSALPWIRLASIALRQHLAADALAAARTGVQMAPESADAHYVLGRARLDQGDAQQAIPELEKAVSMAPNSPESHFALARAYARANMAEKAQQERAAFARLNALAEQDRASHGSQSYQGPREGASSSLLGSGTPASSPKPPQ
jgi:tetratricopeptide (TPR) repeat protein